MNKAHLEILASPEWARTLETTLVPWMDRVAVLGDHVLEIGPGPGLTTDILRRRAARVTAIELDGDLAAALRGRLAGTNVDVLHGDAAESGLPSEQFSAATCFSMLHHVPTADAQDRVLAEVFRLLRPGAAFFATDARNSDAVRAFHEDDTFVPMGDDTVVTRLSRAGFCDIDLELADYEFRFSARKPTAG